MIQKHVFIILIVFLIVNSNQKSEIHNLREIFLDSSKNCNSPVECYLEAIKMINELKTELENEKSNLKAELEKERSLIKREFEMQKQELMEKCGNRYSFH
jgi:hypothetical protein